MAKLKENMLELAGEPQVIQGLPEKGLKEGPYMFERKTLLPDVSACAGYDRTA